MFLSISFSCFTELNTANKKNRPSRKKACVTFWDEIPSTPPKDDANERHTLSNEEEAPIDNPQSWSSSFNDPDLTGVVSRGRNVSFLERYSDDRESTGTSRAGKELAPSDKSTVSLDTKSVSFSQIKSDRKPVVKSCNTESGLPRSTRGNKTVRRWLIDPRLYLVSKDNKRLIRARRCADFVQVVIGPGISVLNHVLTFFRSCRCMVIKLILEIFFWREVSCIVIFPYTGFHRLFLYMDVTNTRLFVSATISAL